MVPHEKMSKSTVKKSQASKPKSSTRKPTKKAKENTVDDEDVSKHRADNLQTVDMDYSWDPCNVTADKIDWPEWAVRNTIKLLDEDNTIPFIARYRREQTNNMEADKLRELKNTLDDLRTVQVKIEKVVTTIEKQEKMTKTLRRSLLASQTMSEVEHLYAPFKSGSKRSLAERAKELGLEPVTLNVLNNPGAVNFRVSVDKNKKGVETEDAVRTGVKHIIADMIAKDKDTMDYVRSLCKRACVRLESSLSKSAGKTDAKESKDYKVDTRKFEMYFNFQKDIKYMLPHQTLAINRGESLKVLSVKVNIPDRVKEDFNRYSSRKWISRGSSQQIQSLCEDAISDSYSRLIQPLMIRHFRSDLTKNAERASIDVFSTNLKRVFLTPPVRGKTVMGLDPGFKHGCKYAIVSANGNVMETSIAYLHTHHSNTKRETEKIGAALRKHKCETIAIGNGTACRETEKWVAECIKNGTFRPLKVVYCIISEAGASIYSASDQAKAELPDIDISGRGAVSIARRLQDPMAELVKIEPKHIGVGMYQHDISESQLKISLDGVVEDCVSFVGVDINVSSEAILRRIAGMSSARVKNIVKWKVDNGPFICRDQIKSVKGIGPKVFEQIAGFVRVVPETSGAAMKGDISSDGEEQAAVTTGRKRKAPAKTAKSKKAKLSFKQNSLDMTSIHPESYDLTERIIREAGILSDNIGKPDTIKKIDYFLHGRSPADMAQTFSVGEPTMKLILDGLQQPLGYDMREKFEKPLFKQGVKSLDDLSPGEILTGQVTNVTHFGAFVDVGVCRDGLVHTSNMNSANLNGKSKLEVGDRIECILMQVDRDRGRIGLKLTKML